MTSKEQAMRPLQALALTLCVAGAVEAQTLKYQPAVVNLVGTITNGMAEGPGGEKVVFPAIKLAVPVRVEPDAADTRNQPEDGVSLIQLVVSSTATMALIQSLKDKPAAVTGTLFHSSSPEYHHTPVLITVREIEPQ
jgi:hypothetical protein